MRVAALAILGRDDEMIRERDALLKIIPHLTISHALLVNGGMSTAYAEGLRKAGIPE